MVRRTSGFAQTGNAAANFTLNKYHGKDAGPSVRRTADVAASDSFRAESSSGAPFDAAVRHGATHVLEGSTKKIKPSDPLSLQFDVSARYGRGKAEKEARRRKERNETDMILALERKKRDVGRAGTGRAAIAAREEEEPEEGSGLHSVGARALFDAKRKLEDDRAAASAKLAAKRAKTAASAAARRKPAKPAKPSKPESAADKKRKQRAARRAIFTDDSESDSPSSDGAGEDIEAEEARSEEEEEEEPEPSPRAAAAAAAQPASHKFTHAPEVIKKIGFDPFGRKRPASSGGALAAASAASRDRVSPLSLTSLSLTSLSLFPSLLTDSFSAHSC